MFSKFDLTTYSRYIIYRIKIMESQIQTQKEKISSALLKTEPSKFWKVLVDIFLDTITEMERKNFQLASSKFAVKEPHLFVKEVPWFKTWYKENKDKYVVDD